MLHIVPPTAHTADSGMALLYALDTLLQMNLVHVL